MSSEEDVFYDAVEIQIPVIVEPVQSPIQRIPERMSPSPSFISEDPSFVSSTIIDPQLLTHANQSDNSLSFSQIFYDDENKPQIFAKDLDSGQVVPLSVPTEGDKQSEHSEISSKSKKSLRDKFKSLKSSAKRRLFGKKLVTNWNPLYATLGHPVPTNLHHKSNSEFKELHLQQEINLHQTVWVMRFSEDGQYLAVAGKTKKISIFEMDSTGSAILKLYKTFEGHTDSILDLSWSKNNFLLSSSMDTTVRLWHASKNFCLCVFDHLDVVPTVRFHPRDDRLFLSGSLDSRVRLWSIPKKKVSHWADLQRGDSVTAVSFSENGNIAIVGSSQGNCYFYKAEKLTYITQIKVRSKKGKNSHGSKICSIHPLPGDVEKILITTNDSRLRIYSLKSKSLFCKYSGLKNDSSQINATFSDDGEYIISGSEDQRVCIWNTSGKFDRKMKLNPFGFGKSRIDSYESFLAMPAQVTSAIFAPSSFKFKLEVNNLRPPHSGHIIICSDYNGVVRVFDNNPVSYIPPAVSSSALFLNSSKCPKCGSLNVSSLKASKVACMDCDQVFNEPT